MSDDQTVFAWEDTHGRGGAYNLLAPEPSCFANCGNGVQQSRHYDTKTFSMTNKCLKITLPIYCGGDSQVDAILTCRYQDNYNSPLALILLPGDRPDHFVVAEMRNRLAIVPTEILDSSHVHQVSTRSIFIQRAPSIVTSYPYRSIFQAPGPSVYSWPLRFWVQNSLMLGGKRPTIAQAHPPLLWDKHIELFYLH